MKRAFALLLVVLFGSAIAFGQPPTATRPKRPVTPPRPVSLEHQYWHFLVYANHLDQKATELDQLGKDGSLARNYLQGRLGMSASDYAVVRSSSTRLAATIKSLDTQAATIKSAGINATTHLQLQNLTAQRDTAVTNEIASLKQSLPPATIKSFEAFITQMFSLSNAVPSTTKLPIREGN